MNTYKCDNIWDYIGQVDTICITTNGCVTPAKKAIMGAGIALEAKNRFCNIDGILGLRIMKLGNHVHELYIQDKTHLVSFPTKRSHFDWGYNTNFPGFARADLEHTFKDKQIVPGWALKSELNLIEQSANELMEKCNKMKWKSVLLPMPGCSNGGLSWDDVNQILDNVFDRRFFIVTKG